MRHDRVLENIWTGRIRAARGGSATDLSRQLRALLPVHHVLLTAEACVDRISVMLDDAELMPALPLGDVIVEELGVDVPYGALVILRDAGSTGPVSYDAGLILGDVLLNLMRTGLFAMDRETDALFAMAASYDKLVEASGFRHSGLDRTEFRTGLAASLGAYWSGVRNAGADTTGLFDRPDFLRRPELPRYLRALDASFSCNGADEIPTRLMLPVGGTRPFDEWVQHVGQVVSAEIGANSKTSARSANNSQRN